MATRRIVSAVELIADIAVGPETLSPDRRPASRTTVEFTNGETAYAYPSDPLFTAWMEFLKPRQRAGKPVYAEIDEVSLTLVTILPMIEQVVKTMSPIPDGFEVMFLFSPAIYQLSKARPEFEHIRSTLERAAANESLLLVATDPESREILEAVEAEEPARRPELGAPPGELTSVVSEERCVKEFNFLAAQPHIPFAYASTCCHARAHEMRALLRSRGIESRKIWLYAKPNEFMHPDIPEFPLPVKWSYHAAPLVATVDAAGIQVDKVIDPSLHDRPVTVDEWIARQRAPNAVPQEAEGRIFYRQQDDKPLSASSAHMRFDDENIRTRDTLEAHRLELAKLRTPKRRAHQQA
jgi:hypothetical protein